MADFQQSFPVRISVMTFNVWGSHHWPARSEPLVQVIQSTRPDVLLLQEVTPEILNVLDKAFSHYDRVKDTTKVGWTNESNIYFNKELFELRDHGCSDLGIEDHPNRGLFWVRLVVKRIPSITVFVSTAHFPWAGCATEIETGMNQRIPVTHTVCENLRRLVPLNEPTIFGGDFNEDFHPLRILNEEYGMCDVFESLDLPPPITHPVRPSDPQEEMRPNRTLDWITSSLPVNCRVIGAFAKSCRGSRHSIPASDHMPVVAFFELGEPM